MPKGNLGMNYLYDFLKILWEKKTKFLIMSKIIATKIIIFILRGNYHVRAHKGFLQLGFTLNQQSFFALGVGRPIRVRNRLPWLPSVPHIWRSSSRARRFHLAGACVRQVEGCVLFSGHGDIHVLRAMIFLLLHHCSFACMRIKSSRLAASWVPRESASYAMPFYWFIPRALSITKKILNPAYEKSTIRSKSSQNFKRLMLQ
jgi:hypothetical protein